MGLPAFIFDGRWAEGGVYIASFPAGQWITVYGCIENGHAQTCGPASANMLDDKTPSRSGLSVITSPLLSWLPTMAYAASLKRSSIATPLTMVAVEPSA